MLIVHSSDDHDDFDDGVGDDVGDDLMMKDCRRDNEGDCLSTSGGGPQVCSQMMMMIMKIKTFKLIMIIIIILLTCYQKQLGQPHDAAIHNVTVENLRYNDATSTLRWITVGLQGRKHRGRLCGIFQCCFWGDRP